MTDADNNAQLRRNSPEVITEDLRRLLPDPATLVGFERMEKALVDELALGQSNGSPEFEAAERETVRTLRTVRRLRMGMQHNTQWGDLREAGFRSTAPPPEEDPTDGL